MRLGPPFVVALLAAGCGSRWVAGGPFDVGDEVDTGLPDAPPNVATGTAPTTADTGPIDPPRDTPPLTPDLVPAKLYARVPGTIAWTQARDEAIAFTGDEQSSHLATINTETEADWLAAIAGDGPSGLWLGGQQIGTDWTWVTDEPFTIERWGRGQPSSETQRYLEIWGADQQTGAWNDAIDDSQANGGYLVEFEVDDLVERPVTGHRYLAVETPSGTWDEASAQARSLWFGETRGHLVTIEDEAEQEWIDEEIGWFRVWVGGLQDDPAVEPDGGWRWVTGELIDYDNFRSGEPNDFGAGERYLGVYADGTWNDDDDDWGGNQGFIVEFDVED